MKILLVTYFQIPHVGGLWKYMQQVKQGLEAQGHQVDLFGNGMDKFYIVDDNRLVPKVHFMTMLENRISLETAPLIASNEWVKYAEIDRYCLEMSLAFIGLDQYDIIHAQDVLAASALQRVKPRHIPLVTSIHASAALTVLEMLRKQNPHLDPKDSVVWKYYKVLEHIGGSLSNKVLLASQWLREVMVHQFSIPDQLITLVPYAIDIPTFLEQMKAEKSINRPDNKKIIISTSRLSHEKGIDILLKSLVKLHQVRYDWECWIVGDGEDRQEYEQFCHQMGLQQVVRFFGNRDDVPYLLKIADIFAMPSLSETLSYSVMEAQLAGLPIVVSNAGGLKEAVRHKIDGLISPVGNSDVLFEHLKILLENPSYGTELGGNARKWAMKNRTLDIMVNRITAVYECEIQAKHST